MTDERLATGLAAWLQDSEIAPPDARMSASRVMAGVSATPQLGHWWPPARLVRRVRPVPALGARVVAPPSPPRTTKGVLSMLTATRIVTAVMVFALVTTGLLAGRTLLPDAVEPPPALTSPLPSATADASVAPSVVETAPMAAESSFAATRVIAELPEGSDPVRLVPAPPNRPGAVFVDRNTRAVMHAEDDGELRVLMQQGIDDDQRDMDAAPVDVVHAGDYLLVIDEAGGVYEWGHWRDSGRLMAAIGSWEDPGELATADPSAIHAVIPLDEREFDLHAVDPAGGALTVAEARYQTGPPTTIERHGKEHEFPGSRLRVLPGAEQVTDRAGTPATDLEAAGAVFVLTSDEVERYVDGERDSAWGLELPDDDLDLEAMSVTGQGAEGEIWLYDAAGRRFLGFDKASGSPRGSWAPAGQPIGEVRGMYVSPGADGTAESVTWLTPTAVMRAALERPRALQPDVTPAPDLAYRLTDSDREGGKRAIDWSDGGVDFKADDLAIRVEGHDVVRPPDGVYVYNSTYADNADLEVEWRDENGREQRVYGVIRADDTHWWIDWIWVYDGEKSGDWIEFQHLEELTRTPLGKSLTGDLRLESTGADREKYDKPGSAVLRIDGLKMSALQPGTRPAPLTDCTPYEDERFEINLEKGWDDEDDTWSTGYSSKILRGPGEPLEGMKAKKMTPKEVEAVLKDLGICYRFRHEWRGWVTLHDGSRVKDYFYDYRCTAPKTGKIIGLTPGPGYPAEDGTAVIYIHVREQKVRDWPEPPPAGTDCPRQ